MWSLHSKARKIFGLLYRQFYNNALSHSLFNFVFSWLDPTLIMPRSAIWSPHVKKDYISCRNLLAARLPEQLPGSFGHCQLSFSTYTVKRPGLFQLSLFNPVAIRKHTF